MELFESVHRVTWDPLGAALVLVEFGDLVQERPAFAQSHAVQNQPYLRSDWVDIWDRGAVAMRCRISVVKEYATTAEAHEGQLAHALEVAALRGQAMRIEVEGGTRTFDFLTAAIESAEPEYLDQLGGGVRVAWVYSIACSQMEEAGGAS